MQTFRNLVLEGGGVKGIAFVGMLRVLDKYSVMDTVERVGGTSAGAINAVLIAFGYSHDEQEEILRGLDFKDFMDGGWWLFGRVYRFLRRYGLYKGNFFRTWIGDLIEEKTGNRNMTFAEHNVWAKTNSCPELTVCATNLSRSISYVFSNAFEETKDIKIIDAVRKSMSFPMFFEAVKTDGEYFVDGGVLRNYPVKLYDHRRYISKAEQNAYALPKKYYEDMNKAYVDRSGEDFPDDSRWPYVYNAQTLGVRLDSAADVAMFREGKQPPKQPIHSVIDYFPILLNTALASQDSAHLHSDDWHRTIYINTHDISTLDFNLDKAQKTALMKWGEEGAETYFKWLMSDEGKLEALNKPQAG